MLQKNEDELDSGDREFVSSLARGLSVIRAFGPGAPNMTLSEVAARTGLTRAAARRFLLTLHTLGYVRKSQNRFELTPRVLELGFAYLSSLNLWDVARPYMQQISEAKNETCSAAVLDGSDIILVARASATHALAVNLNLGARLPAAPTAMGRVLLAELGPADRAAALAKLDLQQYGDMASTDPAAFQAMLEAVRRQGYALTDQEWTPGIRAIAVPVRNSAGEAVAAMCVSCSSSRATMDDLVGVFLPVLLDAAKQIRAGIT